MRSKYAISIVYINEVKDIFFIPTGYGRKFHGIVSLDKIITLKTPYQKSSFYAALKESFDLCFTETGDEEGLSILAKHERLSSLQEATVGKRYMVISISENEDIRFTPSEKAGNQYITKDLETIIIPQPSSEVTIFGAFKTCLKLCTI